MDLDKKNLKCFTLHFVNRIFDLTLKFELNLTIFIQIFRDSRQVQHDTVHNNTL